MRTSPVILLKLNQQSPTRKGFSSSTSLLPILQQKSYCFENTLINNKSLANISKLSRTSTKIQPQSRSNFQEFYAQDSLVIKIDEMKIKELLQEFLPIEIEEKFDELTEFYTIGEHVMQKQKTVDNLVLSIGRIFKQVKHQFYNKTYVDIFDQTELVKSKSILKDEDYVIRQINQNSYKQKMRKQTFNYKQKCIDDLAKELRANRK